MFQFWRNFLDVGDQYFSFNITLMRYVGIWPETRADTVRSTIIVSVMLIYIALQVPVLKSEDMADFTEVGSIIVYDIVIVFKLLHIRIHYRMHLNIPIKMWIPFDTTEGLGFWSAYMICFGVLAMLIPLCVLLHTLYIGLIVMTCGQLNLLSSLLKSITNDEDNALRKKLTTCIDIHSDILRCGKDLENLMNPVMLTQFGGSMSMLCQTGIQITVSPLSNERTIKYLAYIFMVLTDIWIYSFFGNQLLHYSTEVQQAAYSCPWYELENGQQKAVNLVILRAQSPVRLTIGKLYTISLATFSDAVKFSYTVFTLLSQFNEAGK